jgi:hypothetical protein
VIVAVVDADLQLDATEELRGWVEGEPIGAGLELLGKAGDAPVAVRLAGGDDLAAAEKLNADALGRRAAPGIENVRGERGAH